VTRKIYLKKIIISIIFIFLALPAFSSPVVETPISIEANNMIEAGVTFDWISKTQIQRDENIAQIQNILFNEKTVLKYNKKEFRHQNAPFWKDKDSLKNYEDITNGKKEDKDKNYCGFYLGKLLIAYGIQYKNNMKNIYYYDAMGHVRFIDYYSDNYPKFPYYALQYDTSGKLIGTIYFVSNYDQYIFKPDKTFKGRWYKEKMYNRNAKVILTRSNY
jgi:hypothetical protein